MWTSRITKITTELLSFFFLDFVLIFDSQRDLDLLLAFQIANTKSQRSVVIFNLSVFCSAHTVILEIFVGEIYGLTFGQCEMIKSFAVHYMTTLTAQL